jgi:hypothetical protein
MSIDNFATGRRNNLLDPKSLRQIKGTINDGALINRLLAEFKPDLIVRTAASYKDPENWKTDALVNAVGGANIAKACKIHKVGRLIYFQTALCYGTKPTQSADPARRPDQSGQFQLCDLQDRRRALCAIFRSRSDYVPARQCHRPAQRFRPAADLLRPPSHGAEMLCYAGAA